MAEISNTNPVVDNSPAPATTTQPSDLGDSKVAIDTAIEKINEIKEILNKSDITNDDKTKITTAKKEAKKAIDGIMKSKGWWPFGGSKKKTKKSKRKSQKK